MLLKVSCFWGLVGAGRLEGSGEKKTLVGVKITDLGAVICVIGKKICIIMCHSPAANDLR